MTSQTTKPDPDLLFRMYMRSFEDVSVDSNVPFQDVHRLEAWAAMAREPAPALGDRDLLPFIGPALRHMQIVRRLSDAIVCQRADISPGTWLRVRQGQDVPFPEFTRAFIVITGGAFLPLHEAGVRCQLQERYAHALQEWAPAPNASDAERELR